MIITYIDTLNSKTAIALQKRFTAVASEPKTLAIKRVVIYAEIREALNECRATYLYSPYIRPPATALTGVCSIIYCTANNTVLNHLLFVSGVLKKKNH